MREVHWQVDHVDMNERSLIIFLVLQSKKSLEMSSSNSTSISSKLRSASLLLGNACALPTLSLTSGAHRPHLSLRRKPFRPLRFRRPRTPIYSRWRRQSPKHICTPIRATDQFHSPLIARRSPQVWQLPRLQRQQLQCQLQSF